MNRVQTRAQRAMRERRTNRILLAALALLLIAGLYSQFGMFSRISAQTRQSEALRNEIAELEYLAENYRLGIDQFHDHDRILTRATELGMVRPSDSQLRVIRLPVAVGGTGAQSASSETQDNRQ